MANKVNPTAALPSPVSFSRVQDVQSFLTQMVNSIGNEFRDHASRLNTAMMADGTEIPTAPVLLNSYVKTLLPSASKYPNGLIIVSNDTGGLVPAFSDGTNWRRVTDRNVIS